MNAPRPVGSDGEGFRFRRVDEEEGLRFRRRGVEGMRLRRSGPAPGLEGMTVSRDGSVGSEKWKGRGALGVKVGMGMVGGAAGVTLGSITAGATFFGMMGGGIALLGPIGLGMLGIGLCVACVGLCIMYHNGADMDELVDALTDGAKTMALGFAAGFAGGYCCGPGIEIFQMGMPLWWQAPLLSVSTGLYGGLTMGSIGMMYVTTKGIAESVEEERRRQVDGR